MVAVVVVVEIPESLPTLAVVETAMLGSVGGGATPPSPSPAPVTPITPPGTPASPTPAWGGVAARGVGIRGWNEGLPIAKAGFRSSIVLGLMATILAPSGPAKS